jgi:DNA-directed RNA polymerase I, II, and III subunit RPABC3
MTQKNIIFEDTILINELDKDGRFFEKVSRVDATSEVYDCKISFDVNVDIYPVQKGSFYTLVLAKSLNTDGMASPNTFSYDLYTKKNTLLDKYDYVMYGKIFKFNEENDGRVSLFVSFGGLLLSITGNQNHLQDLKIDERIYLLLKKI